MNKLLQDIDSVTEEVTKTKSALEDLLSRNLVRDGSLRRASVGKSTMAGFDDDLTKIKDRLTQSSSKLEIVSIFKDPLITQKFDTRIWLKCLHKYHVKDILLGLLNSMMVLTDRIGGESDEEFAELVYKSLKEWRYLIVRCQQFYVFNNILQVYGSHK
ncbi:putative late blight resistance proteinR1A-10 [Abeliophyllum distichum]|uniref:Late blight resistance proteinR1A-10 n=1 Tax=Abeliophyllum distichum TaxID=126358 RepID=A0ABD1RVK8_9LAMI